MTLRVGVIGTGGIASKHLHTLSQQKDIQIAALCDIDEAKVKSAAEKNGAAVYTDCVTMFEQTELDFVLVCTPPGFRLQPVKEAASRGIACFIEKPPAFDLEDARQMKQVIEESGIIAGVGFMYRYAGAIQKAKELIGGQPVPIVRSVFVCGVALIPDWPRWFFNKSISGGPILDQAIHILDSSRYLVKDAAGDVEQIQCFGSNVTIPKEGDFTIEDSHVVNLRYGKGTVQSHTHSWAVTQNQVKIELISKDYHLIVDLAPETGHHCSTLKGHFKNEPVLFDFSDEDFYVTEMETFLKAVRTKNQSLIRSPYADAAKTLEVVHSANRSAEEGSIIKL
jgi:predicted dehydrogenase